MNDLTLKSWKQQLHTLVARAREEFLKLSARERVIIVVAAAMAIFIGSYYIYQPISEAFASQATELDRAEKDSQTAAALFDRYARLKLRRDTIENKYKEVEIKEGALSYLENLLRTKAGIQSGLFTIKEGQPREFAGNYEQTSFSIKFQTSNLPALVDFLKELVHGERPVILSRVDLAKRPIADRLEVDIEVSSIRRVK